MRTGSRQERPSLATGTKGTGALEPDATVEELGDDGDSSPTGDEPAGEAWLSPAELPHDRVSRSNVAARDRLITDQTVAGNRRYVS